MVFLRTVTTKVLGDKGEDFTCNILREKGYNVIERNYHSRNGEIDIIATDEKFIVFVEVKTRSVDYLYRPMLAVSKSKQNKIIITALAFLSLNNFDLQPRFDICEIIKEKSEEFKVRTYNYIENAFDVGDNYRYF